MPYDEWYNAEGFPQWDFEDVQPGPRNLLEYGGSKYMVGNDHDGQVMYYRRDLIEDPEHQAAFEAEYGYPLGVPQTWDQFRDVAEYFDGKDLNGDGTAGRWPDAASQGGRPGHVPLHVVRGSLRHRPGQPESVLV